MVVKKMMRWPPWPAAAVATKKYTVVVVVRRLQGLQLEEEVEEVEEERRALVVEVKWKGQKKSLRLGSAPPVKRNFTKEGGIGDDGAVEWDEEFTSVCRFSGYKEEGEPLFFPWELAFTVLFNFGLLKDHEGRSQKSKRRLLSQKLGCSETTRADLRNRRGTYFSSLVSTCHTHTQLCGNYGHSVEDFW